MSSTYKVGDEVLARFTDGSHPWCDGMKGRIETVRDYAPYRHLVYFPDETLDRGHSRDSRCWYISEDDLSANHRRCTPCER